MYDSNARLNIITENEDEISDSVATMLSQYNVDVLPFDNKEKLEKNLASLNFRLAHLPLLFFIFFWKNLCSPLKTFVCAIYTIFIEKQPTYSFRWAFAYSYSFSVVFFNLTN